MDSHWQHPDALCLGRYALRIRGNYVTARVDGTVWTNEAHCFPQEWETWEVTIVNSQERLITLRSSHGLWLSIDDSDAVVCIRPTTRLKGLRCTFQLHLQEGPRFAMRSSRGTWIAIGGGTG